MSRLLLSEELEKKIETLKMLSFVASHSEQIKSINKSIDKLENEVLKLRGEFDNYGDEKPKEIKQMSVYEVFKVLRGGLA